MAKKSAEKQRKEKPSSSSSSQEIERAAMKLGWRSGNDWKVGAAMRNQGSSCFLNATLQCLLHAPAFHDWLRFGDTIHQNTSGGNSDNKCIICIFYQTALSAQASTNITPKEMFHWLNNIPGERFIMGQQEDAYLYLCGLIEAMNTTYLSRVENATLSPTKTPMHHLFNGNIENELFCAACNQTRSSYEPFGELVLHIKGIPYMQSISAAIEQNLQESPIPEYIYDLCIRTDIKSTKKKANQ